MLSFILKVLFFIFPIIVEFIAASIALYALYECFEEARVMGFKDGAYFRKQFITMLIGAGLFGLAFFFPKLVTILAIIVVILATIVQPFIEWCKRAF